MLRSPHLYVVDLGRGIAAIAILVFHYQHFFYARPGDTAPSIPLSHQPLYAVLSPLYTNGAYAVQFFWLISGLIFSAVYVNHQVPTRDFIVFRWARLYPLHFVTLCTVAVLQGVSVWATGREEIYSHNDLEHFVLNLFFASHWGLHDVYSFNGPIWSVSVEVLIYVVFWVTLPFLYERGLVGPVLLALAAWVVAFHTGATADTAVFECGFYFFAGAAVHHLFALCQTRPVVLATVGLGGVTAAVVDDRLLTGGFSSEVLPLFMTGMLTLCCAVEASPAAARFRRVRWIGDNTYGTYLWHVPIQILVLIVLDAWVGSRSAALSVWFLAGFLVVTMVVARVSYLRIEAPARRYVRSLATRPVEAPPLPTATPLSEETGAAAP